MKTRFSKIFLALRWVDFFQLAHSVAFVSFGFLILFRLGVRASFMGYLVGGSFFLFGLYRLKYFVRYFSRAYLETRKNSPTH